MDIKKLMVEAGVEMSAQDLEIAGEALQAVELETVRQY